MALIVFFVVVNGSKWLFGSKRLPTPGLKHKILLKKLREVGIDDKDLRIIQNLCYKQEASVRVGNAETETIPMKKGVRQGCVASPDLFNLYQEMIMRATTNMAGIKVGSININNIRYTDDTALVATSRLNLQRLVDKVVVKISGRNFILDLVESWRTKYVAERALHRPHSISNDLPPPKRRKCAVKGCVNTTKRVHHICHLHTCGKCGQASNKVT